MSNESIKKNFSENVVYLIKKNIKLLIVIFFVIFVSFSLTLFYKSIQKKNNIQITEQYTQALILIKQKNIPKSKFFIQI